ncbi:hypothetical protein LSAT2_028277 [Lamellibrachia satsuma]|nr:hypothetical protein LSAT2_028277 [Lamellibrachia satsuma]
MELGRSSSTGAGELWMQVEDTVIAQNMHEAILNQMKSANSSSDTVPSYRPRSRSSASDKKSSRPINMPSRGYDSSTLPVTRSQTMSNADRSHSPLIRRQSHSPGMPSTLRGRHSVMSHSPITSTSIPHADTVGREEQSQYFLMTLPAGKGQYELVAGLSELITRQLELIPGQSELIPGQSELILGQFELIPGQSELIPGQSELIPGQSKLIPGQSELIPGQSELIPGQSELIPGQSEFIPGQSELIPGQSELIPVCCAGSTAPGLPRRVYRAGSTAPGLPRRVYRAGSTAPGLPRRVYLAGSTAPGLPRRVYRAGSTAPGLPRRVYRAGSTAPGLPHRVYRAG